ncbi:MAG: SWIM zinc finger family protein [Nanoarchaeota archaeon]
MRIIKLKTKYKVESESRPGTWYFVDPVKKTCSCPEYLFRMRKIDGICKHINAVEEQGKKKEPTVMTKKIKEDKKKAIKKTAKKQVEKESKDEIYQAIIEYVRVRGSVDTIDLIAHFDEESVADLLRLGELTEENGVISVLE